MFKMEGDVINAAIIGLGGWGKRLVTSVSGKSDRIQFTAAVVRHPDKVAPFAAEHDIRLGADLGEVLDDPTIDTVVVSSAAGVHAEQGLAVIKSGKPVMIVKPLALTAQDAEMLRAEANRAGLVLALGYNRCFLPANGELRARVAAGDLGTPLHAEGNFCVDRYLHLTEGDWKADNSQSISGSLADHMLYEMIRMFGPVAEVHTYASERAGALIKDTAAVLLRFENGASGLLTAIGATANLFRLHVFGTEGWAEVRGTGQFTLQPVGGESEDKTFPAFEAERAQMEALADAIEGKAPYPFTPDQAVQAVAALEAIGRSAMEGGPVTVG
jgi:predicted dehydrogenase